MMKNNVKNIDFSDAINATSAFLTIIIMVLGYSITDGIGIGIVSYTLMHLVSYGVNWIVYAINKKEKPKFEVTVVSIVIAVLFLVYFLVPAVL
jgi:xanthine/uracil/vitamin C permease (AzgA family)